MSLNSPSTHLSVPAASVARRGHRHKRSGAISGDFDVNGLGLYLPTSTTDATDAFGMKNVLNEQNQNTMKSHGRSFSSSYVPSDLYSETSGFFEFRENTKFEFPKYSFGDAPAASMSPRKCQSANILSSPVRFRNQTSSPSSKSTSNQFGENSNTDRVAPAAFIDLNQIIEAELYASEGKSHILPSSHLCDNKSRTTTEDNYSISNPRNAPLAQHSGSPFSSPAFAKQSMKEPFDAAIKEEEDSDEDTSVQDTSFDTPGKCFNLSQSCGPALSLEPENFFSPMISSPPLYLSSVNSSSSSLPTGSVVSQSGHPYASIEKSASNSSKDSSATIFASSGTPKRANAVANRYQNFYDKSLKVSSYLKYSSTDSIALGSSHSVSPGEQNELSKKQLGHSHSLSSLKSSKVSGRRQFEVAKNSGDNIQKSGKLLEPRTSNGTQKPDTRIHTPSFTREIGSDVKPGPLCSDLVAPSCISQPSLNEPNRPRTPISFDEESHKIQEKTLITDSSELNQYRQSPQSLIDPVTLDLEQASDHAIKCKHSVAPKRNEMASTRSSSASGINAPLASEKTKHTSRLRFTSSSSNPSSSIQTSDHRIDRFTRWFRRTK